VFQGLNTGTYLSMDSASPPAKVKENNLETNVKDRFNKERICRCDSDARLDVVVTFSKPIREISYFWGYLNHAVIDTKDDVPVWVNAKPVSIFKIPECSSLSSISCRKNFELMILR
jgi:hypothetical protein